MIDTSAEDLLRIATSLEARSEHPLARAIQDYAIQRGIKSSPINEFQSLTGRGIQAKIEQKVY